MMVGVSGGRGGVVADLAERGVVGGEEEPSGEGEEEFAGAAEEGVGDGEVGGQAGEASQEDDAGFLDAEGPGDPHAEDFGDAGEGLDGEGLGPGEGELEEPGEEEDFDAIEEPAGEEDGGGGVEAGAVVAIEADDGGIDVKELGLAAFDEAGPEVKTTGGGEEGGEDPSALDPEQQGEDEAAGGEEGDEAGAQAGLGWGDEEEGDGSDQDKDELGEALGGLRDEGGGGTDAGGKALLAEEVDFDGLAANVARGDRVVDGFAAPTDAEEAVEGEGEWRGKGEAPSQAVNDVDAKVREQDEGGEPSQLAEQSDHGGPLDAAEAQPEEGESEQEGGDADGGLHVIYDL